MRRCGAARLGAARRWVPAEGRTRCARRLSDRGVSGVAQPRGLRSPVVPLRGGRGDGDSAWRLARVAKVRIPCVRFLWTMPRRRCGCRSGHAPARGRCMPVGSSALRGRAITPTPSPGRSSVVVPGCGLDWLGCECRCGDTLVVPRMRGPIGACRSRLEQQSHSRGCNGNEAGTRLR